MSHDPEQDTPPGGDRTAAVPPGEPDGREPPQRPVFQHPQWMVGVVLIFAVVAVLAGLRNPIWFLIGSPAILVLVIYIWVRLVASD